MSAIPLVIWLPEPIATASRACFSAGTSLTPSPIIAVNRPRVGERADERLLLLGRDPAEDRVLARRPRPARAGRRAGPGPRSRPASRATPSAWATAVTVWRASPEISFRSTSCSRMNSIVSAASGRSVSSSTTSARGSSCGGGAVAGSSGRRPGASPKATTRRPARGVLARAWPASAGGERQRAGARSARRARRSRRSAGAPSPSSVSPLHFHCGRERHLGGRPAAAAAGKASAIVSRVRLRSPAEAAKRPSVRSATSRSLGLGRLDRDQLEVAVGERAGLVDADRVDGGQRLGRADLLDERVHRGPAGPRRPRA